MNSTSFLIKQITRCGVSVLSPSAVLKASGIDVMSAMFKSNPFKVLLIACFHGNNVSADPAVITLILDPSKYDGRGGYCACFFVLQRPECCLQ